MLNVYYDVVDAATDSGTKTYNSYDTLNVDNLIVAGNLTVDGDQTILNVTQLEVEDINIGIASAQHKIKQSAVRNGAGITPSIKVKTLTWDNSNSRLQVSIPICLMFLKLRQDTLR